MRARRAGQRARRPAADCCLRPGAPRPGSGGARHTSPVARPGGPGRALRYDLPARRACQLGAAGPGAGPWRRGGDGTSSRPGSPTEGRPAPGGRRARHRRRARHAIGLDLPADEFIERYFADEAGPPPRSLGDHRGVPRARCCGPAVTARSPSGWPTARGRAGGARHSWYPPSAAAHATPAMDPRVRSVGPVPGCHPALLPGESLPRARGTARHGGC